MNTISKIAILLTGSMAGLSAQETYDFASAQRTRPWSVSGVDPGRCSVGDVYYNYLTSKIRICISLNTFADLSASSATSLGNCSVSGSSSGDLACPGSVQSGDASTSGALDLKAKTSSNTVTMTVDDSSSAYSIVLPASGPSSGNTFKVGSSSGAGFALSFASPWWVTDGYGGASKVQTVDSTQVTLGDCAKFDASTGKLVSTPCGSGGSGSGTTVPNGTASGQIPNWYNSAMRTSNCLGFNQYSVASWCWDTGQESYGGGPTLYKYRLLDVTLSPSPDYVTTFTTHNRIRFLTSTGTEGSSINLDTSTAYGTLSNFTLDTTNTISALSSYVKQLASSTWSPTSGQLTSSDGSATILTYANTGTAPIQASVSWRFPSTATGGTVTITLAWTENSTNNSRSYAKTVTLNSTNVFDSFTMMTTDVKNNTNVTITAAWSAVAGTANNSASKILWRLQ